MRHYIKRVWDKLKEPFDGLFTQGMVCHETYKDQQNKWLSPEEVKSDDGKKFYKKYHCLQYTLFI